MFSAQKKLDTAVKSSLYLNFPETWENMVEEDIIGASLSCNPAHQQL